MGITTRARSGSRLKKSNIEAIILDAIAEVTEPTMATAILQEALELNRIGEIPSDRQELTAFIQGPLLLVLDGMLGGPTADVVVSELKWMLASKPQTSNVLVLTYDAEAFARIEATPDVAISALRRDLSSRSPSVTWAVAVVDARRWPFPLPTPTDVRGRDVVLWGNQAGAEDLLELAFENARTVLRCMKETTPEEIAELCCEVLDQRRAAG